MCERSASSRVTGEDAFDHFEPSGIACVAGASEPLSTTPVDRITARSMKFLQFPAVPGPQLPRKSRYEIF